MIDPYLLVSLLCLTIVSLFQLITLRDEFQSAFKDTDWGIQNDEKLIITDTRNIYLKNIVGAKLTDTHPCPVCPAFGIGAPMMSYIGFVIFGFNNVGFRFFHYCAGVLANLFVVLFIHCILPGLPGMAFSLFFIFSYNLFYLTRCAVVENILSLYQTAAIFIMGFYSPDFFIKHIFIISFLMASSILFKINFPFYLGIFIGLVGIFYFPGFTYFMDSATGFVLGLLIFEGTQCLILSRMGILKERFENFHRSIRIHAGDNSVLPCEDKSVLYNYPPRPAAAPFKTVQYFLHLFYGIKPSKEVSIDILIVLFCLFCLYFMELSRFTLFLSAFVGICFLISAALYYYYKRALCFLFASYCMLICALGDIVKSNESRQAVAFFIIGLVFVKLYIIFREKYYLKRNNLTEKNSIMLESLLPADSITGFYSIPLRFLWQVKRRFLYWEDGAFTNAEMINAAKQKGAGYMVLLTNLSSDFKEKHSLSEVAVINTDNISSDEVYHIYLYKINKTEEYI